MKVLGGWRGPTDPLPLNDGRFLRISVTLHLAPSEGNRRLKVEESSYQYQLDSEGDRWVFRYDYLRHPPDSRPASHLQIRGGLTEECLPNEVELKRVHFPTDRISLEAVIRLLADEFRTPCNSPPEVWRRLLFESESSFLQIAHRSLPSPD